MKYLIFIFIFILSGNLVAQSDSVRYSGEFRFKDGIYLNYEQVLKNNPLLLYNIVHLKNETDEDIYDRLSGANSVTGIINGEPTEILVKDIWGFSKNGTLYIHFNNEFARIPYVGTVCHFIANVEIQQDRYYDPYSMYDPAFQLNPQASYISTKQVLFDFQTGKIMEYNVDNISAILMRTPELFDQYNQLKKKQKKQQMFLYLRKFNEKNPLYIVK